MIRRQRWGICLSIGLLGAVLSALPAVLLLEENVGLDWLFRIRGPIEAPGEVVVISIDAESASVLDLPPDPIRWPRSRHAELVRRLSAAGAAVIVFDIMFDSHRDEAQDLEFAAAVRSAGNVVLLDRMRIDRISLGGTGQRALLETRVPPISALAGAALATAPFPLPRFPDKVSQFWVFGPSDPEVATLPAMALHALAREAEATLIALLQEIRPGSVPRAAVDAPSLSERGVLIRRALRNDPDLAAALLSRLGGQDESMAGAGKHIESLARMYTGADSRYLNFYGPMRTVRTIPYHEILADGSPASFDLAGKVVFVGFSDELPIDQRDIFRTAFSERGQSLSGVEIGATALANLLRDVSLDPLPLPWHFLLVMLWGTAVAAAVVALSTRTALAAAGTAGAAYVLTAAALFRTGTWLPILVPVVAQIPLALLAAFAWNHHRARELSERAKRTLGYYLPAQVVERLSRETSGARPSSELLHGTCLVTDAAQYTSLSERLKPRELQNLLNEYYSVLFAEIDRHGGFVSDVVGDSMVAMWANAKPDPVARASACRAAAAILAAVDRFNADHPDHRLPTRIGIHSGQVLLGDIGAESHFEYRAVGDIVNTATRIEDLNKRLDTSLLVSSEVLDDVPETFTRCVGRFVLAGKSKPLELHDMIGLAEPTPAGQRELVRRFESALASFQSRRWEAAAAAFEQLLGDFPGDGPSRFYLELSRRYAVADPGPSWTGEVVVTEK